MGSNIIPAPADRKTCEHYVTFPIGLNNTNAADTNLQGVADTIWAADRGAKEYATFGAADAAADEIVEVRLTQKDGENVMLVNGQETSGYTYTMDDGRVFPGTLPIAVPAGCEVTGTVKIRKCLTRSQIASSKLARLAEVRVTHPCDDRPAS